MNEDRTHRRMGGVRPLPALLALGLLGMALCLVLPVSPARAAGWSDRNGDGVVDLVDLALFSQQELGQEWSAVDWCDWSATPHKHEKQLLDLLDFVDRFFHCALADPLVLRNANKYPTRLAWGPGAQQLYVTDARANAVFVYAADASLVATGELKGLGTPLGIAVDASGKLYVGNNGRDNVEVYSPDGVRVAILGAGTLQMPNDLAFDASGRLYVVDSRSNCVFVFDPATGQSLGSIGAAELRFPSALAIAGAELFVADQGNHLIRVYDLNGTLLRSLGGEVGQGMLGYKWQGKFIRLQGLAVDAAGRLHALDSHMGVIQILNASTGGFLTSYATQGAAPGQLDLPLGMALNAAGAMAVANTQNQRIELLTPP
ncbi:MAG: NHL repeat-containing protein [Myxococcales bacterium]|nr:NHL repeat-containing protein [Myxococcales bacterium]MDH5306108.1 NHL repeat-containing protein [Myxococcales bacterium]MDH5566367.1 NHL repeat-containing protein [Myxococcales bacterium]